MTTHHTLARVYVCTHFVFAFPSLLSLAWVGTLHPLAMKAPALLTVLPSLGQAIWEGQGLLGRHPLIYDCFKATVWSSNVTEAISYLGRAVKQALAGTLSPGRTRLCSRPACPGRVAPECQGSGRSSLHTKETKAAGRSLGS